VKSNFQLRRDIEDELAMEPSVDATAIGVAVEDGIVTLSGHVASLGLDHSGRRCRLALPEGCRLPFGVPAFIMVGELGRKSSAASIR